MAGRPPWLLQSLNKSEGDQVGEPGVGGEESSQHGGGVQDSQGRGGGGQGCQVGDQLGQQGSRLLGPEIIILGYHNIIYQRL